MILSITGRTQLSGNEYTFTFVYRQIIWLALGFTLMSFVSKIPLDFLKRFSGVIWIFAVIITLSTITGYFGVEGGGARRWIRFGPIGFQPVEFLTIAVVIHLANLLTRNELEGKLRVFFKTVFVTLISISPLLLQPDMGGVILVIIIAMAIFVEARGWFLPVLTGVVTLPLSIYMIFSEGYRIRRYFAFADPWNSPLDGGYQVIQGLIAFANGGLIGRGVGRGFQKLRYLPAAHTDFIFASIGEEFGLIGTLFILFLFFMLTISIFKIYLGLLTPFHRIFIWGIVISLLLPFFINVAGVTKLLPLTGMPLPFLSYGGSSMLFSWVKIGLITGIVRDRKKESRS